MILAYVARCFALVCVFFFCGNKLFAYDSLSVDFSPVITGGLGLRYEHGFTENIRLTVPLEVKSVKLSLLPSEAINGLRLYAWSTLPDLTILTGAGIQLNYEGWYIEPQFKIGYAKIVYLGLTGAKNLLLLQPTFLFGYTKAFKSGFMLNIGLGFSGHLFVPSEDAMSFWAPDATLAVGYAW